MDQITTPEYSLASCGAVAIVCWRRVTVESVRTMHERVLQIAARAPRAQVGLLAVIDKECGLPSADARAELNHGPKRIGHVLAGAAIVYTGEGIRAAAVRGMLLTLGALVRNKVPQKVFATGKEAAQWVTSLVGGEVEAVERAAQSCTS